MTPFLIIDRFVFFFFLIEKVDAVIINCVFKCKSLDMTAGRCCFEEVLFLMVSYFYGYTCFFYKQTKFRKQAGNGYGKSLIRLYIYSYIMLDH